jgi:hypothetical protein
MQSKDWELDEGKESGIKLKFDCVKSFMNTDAFQKFSTKYGLDSEIVASFCESFATHVDLPKEKWFKYGIIVFICLVASPSTELPLVFENTWSCPTHFVVLCFCPLTV